MSIAADSRYAFGDLVAVQLADDTSNIAVFAGALNAGLVEIAYYAVVEGDRFDKLAQRFFNDGTKWWVIADMNPEVRWPNDLVPGTVIRIPTASSAPLLGESGAFDFLDFNPSTVPLGVTRG